MNPFPTSLTAEQVRSLERAREAMRTLLRLEEIRGEHDDLTFRQREDQLEATRAWNETAEMLPLLPRWGDKKWTPEDVQRTVKIMDYLGSVEKNRELDARVRSLIGDAGESGGTEKPRPRDEIRAQFDARVYQHDYTFPTSDVIAQLPYADGSDTRAIADFSDSASLYTSDFSSQVAIYARTLSPWLGIATVVNSDNGRPLVVPEITTDGTVYTPGEGTAITESSATLSSVTVTPLGYKALTYISAEAFEDAEYDLTKALAQTQARAIGLAFGSAATTAVLAGINNGGTATGLGGGSTATFFGYEDLITLQYGRAAPYRTNGVFVMANGALSKTRRFTDKNGQYLWPNSNSTAGQPPILLGGSTFEDPNLAAPASATKSVVYGDGSAALIIKASPIRVAISRDFKFDTDQVAIKTVQRIALGVQDAKAMAYLVSANS